MKHLKKYNESKKLPDEEFFKGIFADFLDDERNDLINEGSYYTMVIYYVNDDLEKIKNSNIDDYIKKYKYTVEIFEEIKVCIGRVKDEFPDIKVEIDDTFRDSVQVYFVLTGIKKLGLKS